MSTVFSGISWLVPVWAAAGALSGVLVERLSRWLALKEDLVPARERWRLAAPPVLAAVVFGSLADVYAGRPVLLAVDSLFALVMVQIATFDLEHGLILDRVVFTALAAAVVVSVFAMPWWAGIASGAVVAAALFLLGAVGTLIFKADALGFGDVKLGALIGVLLGPATTAEAMIIGFAIAGVAGVTIAAVHRSMQGEVALGPFLVAGAVWGLLHPL